MGRKKVGQPVSVALTDTQRQWITEQGTTASEAIRGAIDAKIEAAPTGHLKELIRQAEAEVIRLDRLGHLTEGMELALQRLWRLVLQG